jgi:hypothetical protein
LTDVGRAKIAAAPLIGEMGVRRSCRSGDARARRILMMLDGTVEIGRIKARKFANNDLARPGES